MRRSHLAVYIGLALAFAVSAAPPLTITDAGYFLTVIGDDDVPTYVEIEDVFDLRTGTPNPIPPTDPDPSPPTGIVADVAEWATEIGDPQASQKYALLFKTVRLGVLNDRVSLGKVYETLAESADAVVSDEWDPFRRRLSDHLAARTQEGKLGTAVQIANELAGIADGLEYSADGSESLTDSEREAVVSEVNSIINRVNQ